MKTLPESRALIWQRGVLPDELISAINAPDTQAWLLFPADRTELISRQKTFQPDPSKKTLIIVPDGTWKEVRKIVRKSPWLEQLPIIAFNPNAESRYKLRRNDHAEQLCTAEAVTELLLQGGEAEAAGALNHAFEWFIHRYVEQQNHRAATSPAHLLKAGTEPQ